MKQDSTKKYIRVMLILFCAMFVTLSIYLAHIVSAYGTRWFASPYNTRVQNLKTSLFKLQVAFKDAFDKSAFGDLDVLSYTQQGSVANMIVRGDRDACKHAVAELSPLLMEILPLTLEEVFLYEMESLGYAFGASELEGGNRA